IMESVAWYPLRLRKSPEIAPKRRYLSTNCPKIGHLTRRIDEKRKSLPLETRRLMSRNLHHGTVRARPGRRSFVGQLLRGVSPMELRDRSGAVLVGIRRAVV